MDEEEAKSNKSSAQPKGPSDLDKAMVIVNSTTMHGIGRILSAFSDKNRIAIALWGAIFSTAVILFIFVGSQRIMFYLSHPSETSYDNKFVDGLALPAVTVCNKSPYDELKVLLWRDQGYPNANQFCSDLTRATCNISGAPPPQQIPRALVERVLFTGNQDLATVLSFQIPEMLVSCGDSTPYKCSHSNFTTAFNDFLVGNCHTIVPKSRQVLGGAEHGVTIVMRSLVNRELVSGGIAFVKESNGLLVMVHDPAVPPVIGNAVLVSPGSYNMVKVHRKDFDDETPTRKCRPNTSKNILYSQEDCLEMCSKQLRKDCVTKLPECDTSCLQHLTNCSDWAHHQAMVQCLPRCPPRCRFASYTTTMTTIDAWPSDTFTTFYFTELASDNICPKDFRTNRTSFEICRGLVRDMVKIRVFYGDMFLETVTRRGAYTITELISEIGGSSGLFIGCSVITFAEVGAIFFFLGRYELHHKKRKRRHKHRHSSLTALLI